jgi:hypothetical protein
MKRAIGTGGLALVVLVLAVLGAGDGVRDAAAQQPCAVVQGRVVCPDGGQGQPSPTGGSYLIGPCQPGGAAGTVVCGYGWGVPGITDGADAYGGYLTRTGYTGWNSGCTHLGSAIRCGPSPWDQTPIGWPIWWIE